MKVVVLYRPNSEGSRDTEEFIRDMQKRYVIDEQQIEILDYDSVEGAGKAKAYGIMAQPAIVVLDDSGGYVQHWEGALPLMQDIAGYLYS